MPAGRVGRRRRNRLEHIRHRQHQRASTIRGAQTGPHSTDRGTDVPLYHVIFDGVGTPLAIDHVGANMHASQTAVPMVDSFVPIKTSHSERRNRPD